MKVDPNLNVILTASLTVYVGCYRSVKPTPPTVSITRLGLLGLAYGLIVRIASGTHYFAYPH